MSLASTEELLAEAVALAAPLRRFFERQLRDGGEAEDLLQELYFRILKIQNTQDIRAPKAYLFTMAAHIAGRHGLRRNARPDAISLEYVAETIVADRSPVEEVAEAVSTLRRLEELDRRLEQLPPKVKAAVIWHHRDGYTCEEIGKKLSVGRNRVKKYLIKGLAHCRSEAGRPQEGSA